MSASTATPPKEVSSLDHFVTQWMSQGTRSNGSASTSSRLQVVGRWTMPSIVSVQSAASMRGVGPAVKTGKSRSRYWPGGIRAASSSGVRRRPVKPREIKVTARLYVLRRCGSMKLEGIHHITAITGDAPRNVDFYARVLG